MLEFSLVLSLALFVRLVPLRLTTLDFDSWGHLYVATEVKNQKASPWGGIYLKCWEPDEYRHPYLWHGIIGRLPIEKLSTDLKWLNGCVDAFFTAVLYVVLGVISIDPMAPVVGTLLYLFSQCCLAPFP